MGFADKQLRKLQAPLNPQHVKSRKAEAVTLHYLEGWHVVAEANRIFGFDGWDREMVACQCVWTKQLSSRFAAAYIARVRITVRAGDSRIIREGSGAGDATGLTPGEAHEFAAKAAETDATKRALSTFGNAFGLSLYRGAPEPPAHPPTRSNGSSATPMPNAPAAQALGASAENPPASARVAQPVDKSMLARSEPKRLRDLDHLKFVANQPCLICGRQPSHAHHLTFTQPNALGRKVSDEFTVPLCNLHHRELHDHGNERTWWIDRKMNPLPAASELWIRSHGWSVPADGALVNSEATDPGIISNVQQLRWPPKAGQVGKGEFRP